MYVDAFFTLSDPPPPCSMVPRYVPLVAGWYSTSVFDKLTCSPELLIILTILFMSAFLDVSPSAQICHSYQHVVDLEPVYLFFLYIHSVLCSGTQSAENLHESFHEWCFIQLFFLLI